MSRIATGKRYALVLAEYVSRFHSVPPSILTEAGATDVMVERLQQSERVRATKPAEGEATH